MMNALQDPHANVHDPFAKVRDVAAPEPILRDFSECKAWNASVALESNELPDDVDCSDCLALILAHQIRTDPLVVNFEDGSEPVTCIPPTEDLLPIRPLQEYEEKPAVAWAVEAAKNAGARSIFVLVPEDIEYGLAVRNAALEAGADVCIPFQSEEAAKARLDSRAFELFGIPEYFLEIGRDLLALNPPCKDLLIIGSDQVRVSGTHLRQLAYRKLLHPNAQAVSSWIVWLRRFPILVSGEFLGELDARKEILRAVEAPYRPIDQLRVEEVVFGEEMIAPSPSHPAGWSEFFEGLTLNSLEAVRLARRLAELDAREDGEAREAEKDSEFQSERQAERDAEREKILAPLSDSDGILLAAAIETLEQAHHATASDASLAEDLIWANAWGTRNKSDFPFFSDRRFRDRFVFLDSAATAQRLGDAIETQRIFDLHENANVYRGGYDLSMQATINLNDARKAVEDFIGSNRRETIYTANTTGGVNLIAQSWGETNIGEGDLILVPINEHHSNLVPWMMLAERKGARLAYIPMKVDGSLDMDAYRTLLEQKPKLVTVAHISNVIGIENPVHEMAELAHAAGARIFVDGAQALPHLGVKVRELGVDFYAFSSHKLYGPLGIGGVWVNPDAYAEMAPTMSGGGAISHVSLDSYYLRLGAIAYEWGTPPISAAMGLASAVRFLDSIGMDAVERHSTALTRLLIDGLGAIEGISVFGNHTAPEGLTGLVSLDVANMAPNDICEALSKIDVAVRSGGHCALPLAASLGLIGSCRISIGIYNTVDDILAALTGLRLCRFLYPDGA